MSDQAERRASALKASTAASRTKAVAHASCCTEGTARCRGVDQQRHGQRGSGQGEQQRRGLPGHAGESEQVSARQPGKRAPQAPRERTTHERGAPSAAPASWRSTATDLMASSLARTMIGSISTARAKPAARVEGWCMGRPGLEGEYADDYGRDPTHDIGAKPQRPGHRAGRSNRKSAVSKPAGAAMSKARPTVRAVPAMAVEMPPPGTPKGTTGWTRKPNESAGKARVDGVPAQGDQRRDGGNQRHGANDLRRPTPPPDGARKGRLRRG